MNIISPMKNSLNYTPKQNFLLYPSLWNLLLNLSLLHMSSYCCSQRRRSEREVILDDETGILTERDEKEFAERLNSC
jgi:hypothetical protein